jgi:hypothetical protein
MWMFDAPMGYHQLAVEKSSQEKLAFQGVDAIKWTYTVMPFGPTNGPATFINFIHGPFEFATVHGRKTRDRVSQDDWDILQRHSSMFQNPLPRFDVPTYSIHIDRGAHVSYHDENHCDNLRIVALQTSEDPGNRCFP